MGARQSQAFSNRPNSDLPIEPAQDLTAIGAYTLSSSSAENIASEVNSATSKIVVVNSSARTSANKALRPYPSLPPRVLPILSIDGHQIDSKRHSPEHQLNSSPWIEFISTLEQHLRNRADLVAARQGQLEDKIIQTEEFVTRFTEAYVHEKHKAIAKINDDSRKVDELYNILNKCERLTDSCINSMNRLNSLLPSGLALEEFS